MKKKPKPSITVTDISHHAAFSRDFDHILIWLMVYDYQPKTKWNSVQTTELQMENTCLALKHNLCSHG